MLMLSVSFSFVDIVEARCVVVQAGLRFVHVEGFTLEAQGRFHLSYRFIEDVMAAEARNERDNENSDIGEQHIVDALADIGAEYQREEHDEEVQ